MAQPPFPFRSRYLRHATHRPVQRRASGIEAARLRRNDGKEQKGAIESKTQSDPSDANDVRNVLDLYRQLIARNIHAQMTAHSYEAATQYVVEVT